MTGALVVYAATFMRYSLAVTPKNYLLFACHLTNFGAQTTQAYRYLNYWKCVPRISIPAYPLLSGGYLELKLTLYCVQLGWTGSSARRES